MNSVLHAVLILETSRHVEKKNPPGEIRSDSDRGREQSIPSLLFFSALLE